MDARWSPWCFYWKVIIFVRLKVEVFAFSGSFVAFALFWFNI
jgi:hypothetical protein